MSHISLPSPDLSILQRRNDILKQLKKVAPHATLITDQEGLRTFESDALTAASAALIPAILAAVQAMPVPEVAVVGHTDTMGEPKTNVALGLKRAMTVRNILVRAGLAASTVDVSSHGEADLLFKTRDKTPEPRNRRVEISVR